MAQVGLESGQYVQVCLDHYQLHEEMRLRKIQMYQELAERAEDDIAVTLGLPRKPRPQRIPAARVNVHQVNIHGDNLGVVNTGTVGSIANSLTIIHGHDATFAAKLKVLTEAIIASTVITAAQKQEAVELLNEVADDAAKPPQQRRARSAMKTIAAGLGQVLSHAADLYTLWTAIEPHLK